jgi:hypothetical protein
MILTNGYFKSVNYCMENMSYDHNNNVDNMDPDHMMWFPLRWLKDSKTDLKQFISKAFSFSYFMYFQIFSSEWIV